MRERERARESEDREKKPERDSCEGGDCPKFFNIRVFTNWKKFCLIGAKSVTTRPQPIIVL